MADDQPKYYTIKEAATKLHFSYHKLTEYKKAGLLNVTEFHNNDPYKLKTGPKAHGIDEAELKRIEKLIQPPEDGLTARQFSELTHLSEGYLRNLILKLHIEPIFKQDFKKIVPNKNYYYKSDLKKINQYLYQKNMTSKYLNVEQTTDTFYNPRIHFTISDLGTILNEKKAVSSIVIARWVNIRKVPYNIDPNGKLYFTKNEVEYIKSKYHHLPDNLYGNHQKLADALFLDSSTLSNFRNIYHLPATKVLGYKDVFYTQDQANKIIEYYKHPDLRPSADYSIKQKPTQKTSTENNYESEFIDYFKSLNQNDQNRIFKEMWNQHH